jgi:hypothetical protein
MWRFPAFAGAVLMPASLFLDWYGIPPNVFGREIQSLKGWDIFESTDSLMVLAAVATLVLLIKAPPRVGGALTIVGAIATEAVAIELFDKPSLFALPSIPGMSIEVGAWLGLLGALLILAAGVLSSATTHRARRGANPGGS